MSDDMGRRFGDWSHKLREETARHQRTAELKYLLVYALRKQPRQR